MKKTILILACGMSFLTGFSQELPKWASKARKAVFSVITYNKENQILNTGNELPYLIIHSSKEQIMQSS